MLYIWLIYFLTNFRWILIIKIHPSFNECLFYFVLFYSFYFQRAKISGLLMIAVAVYSMTHSVQTRADDAADETRILAISCIIIGGITTFITIPGCLGAVKDNNCLLMTYSVLLFILLVIQIMLTVVIFMVRHEVQEAYAAGIDEIWANRNKNLEHMQELETTFKCCGNNDPNDYRTYGFGGFFTKTCCEPKEENCSERTVYSVGCKPVIVEFFDGYYEKFSFAMAGVATAEAFGIIFGCFLANQIRGNIRRRSGY